jgi:hypothetical protein
MGIYVWEAKIKNIRGIITNIKDITLVYFCQVLWGYVKKN